MSKPTCYSCIHYRPTTDKKTGICTFLDDFAGQSYYVNPKEDKCLHNLNPSPAQLSQAEARARDKQAEGIRNARAGLARKIANEVASWSEWKRRMRYIQSKPN